jgi:ferric-dicitrate binding protein FerR (iron transport regulator)
MTEPLNDKQIDQLIADYLAGSLSEADRPTFEAWLRASPDNPRRVARLSAADYCIREVCQDTKADYLLDVLNQIDEAAGPADLVTLHDFQQPAWHRYRLPLAIGSAIAAVLVIAVTLIITLQNPGNDPTSIADNTPVDSTDPRDPGLVGPALTNTVATITATHNATWAEGASAPGSQLRAGQRLTLTAGFAEITTHRGAIAILEAPATIELLDNDNALRLHTGKLVGICETPSSKGFVVRTPHMDITDLGTRFGIDLTDRDVTEVHVIEGSVEASRPIAGSTGSQRVLLMRGDAVRASEADNKLAAIEQDTQRFASLDALSRRGQFVLSGTGQGLSQGDEDANWQVIAIGNDPLDKPIPMLVTPHLTGSQELANAAPGVQYVQLTKEIVRDIERYVKANRIRYTVRTTLELPADFDPTQDAVGMRFQADEQLLTVRINGHETAAPPNQFDALNAVVHRITIPGEHLRPGPNTVELEVSDLIRSNAYMWGLGVAWHLETDPQRSP